MERIKTKSVLVVTMLAVLMVWVGGCHTLSRHDDDYDYSRRADRYYDNRDDDRRGYDRNRWRANRYYDNRDDDRRGYDRNRW
jgi:hypothetical protein